MDDDVSLREPVSGMPGDRPALPSGDGRRGEESIRPAKVGTRPAERNVFELAAELKSMIRGIGCVARGEHEPGSGAPGRQRHAVAYRQGKPPKKKDEPMTRLLRYRAVSCVAMLLAALLASAPGESVAQADTAAVPENARARSYSGGWECVQGYREIDRACVAVLVPANAYATGRSYGSGWECARGYDEIDGRCVEVTVPANAFLNSSGVRWECLRGYRKADGACVAIEVPVNGYLSDSSYDAGWRCDRGYRAVGDACIAVEIPTNAYFVDSGYNTGWECERGYRAMRNTCVSVEVPANAHLDYSGNGWECDRPYRKRGEGCVLP